jgi:hypothetical protein
MVARPCLVAALLALACGGPADNTEFSDPGPTAGAGGTAAPAAGDEPGSAGASQQGGSTATAGGATAGSAGAMTIAGSGGAPGGAGGQPGAPGTSSGGAGMGGMATGGKPSDVGGSGGKAAGGAGGQASDPLAPKPAPGCPGYVDFVVPNNTCLWLHGAKFTMQDAQCSIANPEAGETSCATVTATAKELVSRVSDNVQFERFNLADLQSSCSDKCN